MKVDNIYVCPKCDFATTGQSKPKFCRECGYSFIENNFNTYTTPITITEQLIKLDDVEGARDAILSLTQGKALAILEDAQKILETISGRKAAAVDIRPIVECAMLIGQIGKAYDDFIKAGGKHVPSLYINNNHDEEKKNESTKSGTAFAGAPEQMLESDTERVTADDQS